MNLVLNVNSQSEEYYVINVFQNVLQHMYFIICLLSLLSYLYRHFSSTNATYGITCHLVRSSLRTSFKCCFEQL